MYIPKHYLGSEGKEAIAFMQRFPFGTIITSVNGVPIATHLPFVTHERDNEILITSHFAKANDQWQHIVANENLIVFSEPHAYISPKNYHKNENVPTWNYIAVHAYGKAKIIDQQSETFKVLEIMINNFEPNYKDQWNALSNKYKLKMSNGIVAFEIQVSKLQSKEKLSQNKKQNERNAIIESLSKSNNPNERTIAEYMKYKELQTKKNNRL